MSNLMVWGDNSAGQKTGAQDPQYNGDYKALASGGSINGLALRTDATPFLWGQSPGGGYPPGVGAIPNSLRHKRFDTVAVGRDDAVLVRENGLLEVISDKPSLKDVPGGFYSAVAVGAVHAVAIAQDGTLKAWGDNTWGTFVGLLNAPEGGPFKEVSARVLYSFALHQNGTLYGWGKSGIFNGWTPTPANGNIFYLPNQAFGAIAAGNVHAFAILPDGTPVAGWGDGTGGALQAPMYVRFRSIAAGWGFSVGIATDGTLWGWGTVFRPPALAVQPWTFETEGWVREPNTDHYYVPNLQFKAVEAAAFHIVALKA